MSQSPRWSAHALDSSSRPSRELSSAGYRQHLHQSTAAAPDEDAFETSLMGEATEFATLAQSRAKFVAEAIQRVDAGARPPVNNTAVRVKRLAAAGRTERVLSELGEWDDSRRPWALELPPPSRQQIPRPEMLPDMWVPQTPRSALGAVRARLAERDGGAEDGADTAGAQRSSLVEARASLAVSREAWEAVEEDLLGVDGGVGRLARLVTPTRSRLTLYLYNSMYIDAPIYIDTHR